MKLLFITEEYPSAESGVGVRPYYFIKYLHDNYGHEIHLVSFSSPQNNKRGLGDYCESVQIVEVNNTSSILGYVTTLTRSIIPTNSMNSVYQPFTIYSGYSKFQRLVDMTIEKEQPDVILCGNSVGSYVANSDLRKMIHTTDANSVYYKNQIKNESSMYKIPFHILRHLQENVTEKYLYSKFNTVITVTGDDKVALERNISDVKLIPNGVEKYDVVEDETPIESPSIIISGVMNSTQTVKGITYFYENIYPLVKKKYPDLELWLVGKNPSPYIQDINKNDDSVSVTGYVDDIRPYLVDADVFAYPAMDEMGIKNKILEAMICGTPVVTTESGVRGIEGSSGIEYLVVDPVPEIFESAVTRLLEDEHLANEIGEAGRELMLNKYTWEAKVERLNSYIISGKNEGKNE